MAEDLGWRDVLRGGPAPPPAAPRSGETSAQFHAAQQTQLLTRMASDIATLRNIAVFFTVLWGIGVLIFLVSLFVSM